MMNWQTILIEIAGTILSAVAVWVLAKVRTFINTKITDEKLRDLAEAATSIVSSVVKATYQTYVENIKGTEAWTKETQREALQRALAAAKAQMSEEIETYIKEHYGDVDEWLTGQIEAEIYTLKAQNGGGENENG